MYEEGLVMHYKHPLFSTDVGLLHRNIASAHLRLGHSKEALVAYKVSSYVFWCFLVWQKRWCASF